MFPWYEWGILGLSCMKAVLWEQDRWRSRRMAASDLLLVTNQVLFVDENTQLMKYNFNPLPGKAWSGMQESYKPGSALSSKNGRKLPLSHDLFVKKKKQHPKPQSCWPFLPLGLSTLGRFLRTGSKMKAIAWFTANIWLSTSPPPLVQMFLLPPLLIFDPLVSVPGDGFHHPIRNNTLVLIPFLWERQGVTPHFSCSLYGGPPAVLQRSVSASAPHAWAPLLSE